MNFQLLTNVKRLLDGYNVLKIFFVENYSYLSFLTAHGFDHEYRWNSLRDKTVPYAIGIITEAVGREL